MTDERILRKYIKLILGSVLGVGILIGIGTVTLTKLTNE